MNKRIKELAEQARLLTGWPNGETDYQKFAELIINECIDAVKQQDNISHAGTTYDRDMVMATVERCIRSIEDRFK